MDKQHHEEMAASLDDLEQKGCIKGKKLYLFGHCNATEELTDMLLSKGYRPVAILDNNKNKQGNDYKGIAIVPPQNIMSEAQEDTVVCIVARAYAAMSDQLKRLGYRGQIRKLVDYNSYAEYSLSEDTMARMKARVERGQKILSELSEKYPEYFKILCPFQALGDIGFMMSYLPYFLEKRNVSKCLIGVVGSACMQVARLYCPNADGTLSVNGKTYEYQFISFSQKDMDETIQAVIYRKADDAYIPHQDRPYVCNLFKALYTKKIPLEQIYCCGVFGLSAETVPVYPTGFTDYPELSDIPAGKSVIFAPYAKSVTALSDSVWKEIVSSYLKAGYTCFTNVAGDEKPLDGTIAISPEIQEMQSVVERAGIFVGIRSGLCDVLRKANAKKIALYPDYNYCDTQWKAIDMYAINGWRNIVVKGGFVWQMN